MATNPTITELLEDLEVSEDALKPEVRGAISALLAIGAVEDATVLVKALASKRAATKKDLAERIGKLLTTPVEKLAPKYRALANAGFVQTVNEIVGVDLTAQQFNAVVQAYYTPEAEAIWKESPEFEAAEEAKAKRAADKEAAAVKTVEDGTEGATDGDVDALADELGIELPGEDDEAEGQQPEAE
jgi:hypothetical protein